MENVRWKLKMGNRKTVWIGFLSAVCILMMSFAPKMHKYYVGLTEVNIDSKKHTLNVSTKLFMDDLEAGLFKTYNKKVDLSTSVNNKEVQQLLVNYLDANFKINVGGKLYKLKFVGYEVENDAVWCYSEVVNFKGKGTVSVYNTLLYESFPEQSNLMNVNWDGVSKSVRLINPEKLAEFIF